MLLKCGLQDFFSNRKTNETGTDKNEGASKLIFCKQPQNTEPFPCFTVVTVSVSLFASSVLWLLTVFMVFSDHCGFSFIQHNSSD